MAMKALLFIALGLMLFNLSTIPLSFGQATQLEIVAPSTAILVPTQFNINIDVVNVTDLYAWQIKLYYNSTVLRWINATYPPGHVFDGRTFIEVPAVNLSDVGGSYILFTASLQGPQSGFNGTGALCRISFEAQATGNSTLIFSRPLGADGDTWLSGSDLLFNIPFAVIERDASNPITAVGDDTRLPSAISMSVAPLLVIAGHSFTVNGTTSVTVPDNTPVYVEYSASNATPIWRLLTMAFSNGSKYSYLWKPTSADDGLWDIRARWEGNAAYRPATSLTKTVAVMPDYDPPVSHNDYEGLWRTADFTINLSATDDLSGVAEIWYKMNEGTNKTVRVDGQPRVITESANNTLEYWSVDIAGNQENHTVLKEIKLDKTAPTGSFTINNGATYTNKTTVALRLSAMDATSGIAEMRLSNDNVTYTDWQIYVQFKPWILQEVDGVRTVYLQLRDSARLISQVYSQTIILDPTPPIISVISPSNNSVIRSSTVTVTWEGSDNTSDIAHYELRLDRGFWVSVGTNTTQIFTGFGDGAHSIEIKAVNKVGLEKVISVSFNVDTSLLFGLGFLEVIGILAVIILVILGVCIYFFKIRKQPLKGEGRLGGKFE